MNVKLVFLAGSWKLDALSFLEAHAFVFFSFQTRFTHSQFLFFRHQLPNAPKARSYKIKMCSNNAPIVAKIHEQFFFPLFKTTPSKFSAKILPPLQRRGILHVLNFENNRRSLRSRQKTFTKPVASRFSGQALRSSTSKRTIFLQTFCSYGTFF